jgi:dUTP pyrophosphatase
LGEGNKMRPLSDFLGNLIVRMKKLHPKAVIPQYAKPGDAGLDLTAISKEWDEEYEVVVFGIGLAIEIPAGYVGLIFPRSSNFKVPLSLSNCVGVVDSGYRGEVKFMFRPTGRPRKNYEVGDRVGQLIVMPIPKVAPTEVTELSETERGVSGFGSSGK